MSKRSEGFPAIAAADARVLILGSLPGTLSLERQQYYAKPQNQFWTIMGELVGASPELPYGDRLRRLTEHRIALWDVCHSAIRPGALDAAILPASVVANDFAAFLQAHPAIALVCFNGAKAAKLYIAKVLSGLPAEQQAIPRQLLPSTSPAHAAMPFDEKLRRWHAALGTAVPLG